MAFQNAVVGGGGELVREAIHSRSYVPGISGWTINRDGSAEFNDVTVRGDLIIGTPPSPPNAYILGEVLGGVPMFEIFDGTHSTPARIQGYNLGNSGGLVLDTGEPATESMALALGGSIGELVYENFTGTLEFCFLKVGPPFNEAIKMRATGGGSQDLELGFDMTNPTPDGIAGRLYTYGEVLLNALALDANYGMRIADGKVAAATATTAVNVATDVNITGANAQNVYLEDGYVYRALISIDQRSAVAGNRLDYKLWDGAVGGTQLGGTVRRFVENTGANFDNQFFGILWRQVGTGISANINLSAARAVGAGACDVAVNNAYFLTIEKCGDADKIGSL
ncbi:hypothetical protein [Planomonospora sp. ID82291]|uniref:hypothetical protein n=1 Tax=Planomonospora sp. ID82291 TaxID=2738136 RepID=UPI0018C3D39E|nr:hypothetical protein [Planomonospora sp. ID82291]MBG0819131.1 hypothetical protein [Planomonospora sp. ID82291]